MAFKVFSLNEIEQALKDLPEWTFEAGYITRNYVFKDFRETLAVMVEVGFVAEELNHHPEWFNVYNRLEIKLNTHDAGGITAGDFELAKRIEQIAQARKV